MKTKERVLSSEAEKSKSYIKLFVLIGVGALLYFIIWSYMFPYSGDDWAWGSSRGIGWLKTFFQDVNGRYSGNLLVMALTRVPVLKAVVMGISYFFSCFFLFKFAEAKKPKSLIFSIFLFFCVPTGVLTQAMVWTSGFANYVPSILIVLGYVLLIENVLDEETPHYAKGLSVLTFIMGFIGAMFMENITVYAVVVAFTVVIYSRIKFKKAFAVQVSYLAGSIIGAVAMFTNPIYLNVLLGKDYYRNIAVNKENPLEFIINHLEKINARLFFSDCLILVVMTVMCIILVKRWYSSEKEKSIKLKRLVIACCVISCAAFVCFFIKSAIPGWGFYGFKHSKTLTVLVFTLICVAYYLSVFVISMVCLEGRTAKIKAAFALMSIVVMTAPLVIVNPIGSRNFFSMFLMWAALTMIMFENVRDYVVENFKHPKAPMRFACVALAILSVSYMFIFVDVHFDDKARIKSSREQSENGDVVVVHQLDDYGLVWDGNPNRPSREKTYKDFYGLDPDDEIKYVRAGEEEEQK